jgi:phosphohistidine phosphatase
VAQNCGYDGKIDTVEEFYPGGPAAYLRVLSELPEGVRRVMIVGHNPGLEEFLKGLVGESGLSAWQVSANAPTLPTAALAQVEIPLEAWQDLTASTHGKLVKILRPAA